MSANISVDGKVRKLDASAEPDELVTEQQAKDPNRVARLLATLLRDVAVLKRRWWPHRIDFEGRVVDATGTTKYRLQHNVGAGCRWCVVDWQGTVAASLSRHADTDGNTLVLVSYTAGTATIRVEETG